MRFIGIISFRWVIASLLILSTIELPFAFAEPKCVPGRLIPGSFIIRHNKISGSSESQKAAVLSARSNKLSQAGAESLGVTKSLDSVEFVRLNPASYLGEIPASLKILEDDGSIEEVIPDREICAFIESGVSISGSVRLDKANIPRSPLTLLVAQDSKVTSVSPTTPPRILSPSSHNFEPISLAYWDANRDGLPDLFVQNDGAFETFGSVIGGPVGDFLSFQSPLSPFDSSSLKYWNIFNPALHISPKPSDFLANGSREILVLSSEPASFKFFAVSQTQGRELPGGAVGLEALDRSFGVGDLNSDGRPDLVRTDSDYTGGSIFFEGEWYSEIETRVSVIQINEDGTTTTNQLFDFRNPGHDAYVERDILIEDLDGNGFKDVLILTHVDGSAPGDFITVSLQHANGSFTSLSHYMILDGAYFSAGNVSKLVDLNRDGRPEIINFNDRVYVFQNNGLGQFSPTPFAFGLLDNQIIAEVTDYNRDGRPDVLLSKDRNITLWANTSEGSQLSFAQSLLASFSQSVSSIGAYDPIAIVNAKIILSGVGGTYSTETDGLGNYEFKNIPTGTYYVSIIHDSNYSFRFSNIPLADSPAFLLDSSRSDFHFTARQFLPEPPVGYFTPLGAPSDQGFPHLWGLSNVGQADGIPSIDINALRAWELTKGNFNQIVAVLDSGIDYNHPEQEPSMWRNPNEVPNNGVDDDGNGIVDDIVGYNAVEINGNPMDFAGHGTHVAGIIGAPLNPLSRVGIVGVSPNSALMAVRILNENGGGSLASEIRGMDYIVRMKDRGVNIIAVNGSYGGAGVCNQAQLEFLQLMNDRGIVFVAAAGNGGGDGIGDNNDTNPLSPANCASPNVVSVANLDRTGQLHSSSNFGLNSVHIGAPGTDIWSTVPNSQYREFSGTSMAAPHVAGVVALIKARDPSLSPVQIKTRLMNTIKPLAQLNGKLAAPGIVDAHAALLQSPPIIATPNPGAPSLSTPPKPRLKVVAKGIRVSMSASPGAIYKISYTVTPPKVGTKKPKKKSKIVTTSNPAWLLRGVKPGSKVEVVYRWQIGNPGTLVSAASAKATLKLKPRST